MLQPPLGPLTDRGASIDVACAAVELVTQSAESLSSFAPCGCGDGAPDTLPGGGIAPDLEDGEPLAITGALEDRPLAVTSPTPHEFPAVAEGTEVPRPTFRAESFGVRAVDNLQKPSIVQLASRPKAGGFGAAEMSKEKLTASARDDPAL